MCVCLSFDTSYVYYSIRFVPVQQPENAFSISFLCFIRCFGLAIWLLLDAIKVVDILCMFTCIRLRGNQAERMMGRRGGGKYVVSFSFLHLLRYLQHSPHTYKQIHCGACRTNDKHIFQVENENMHGLIGRAAQRWGGDRERERMSKRGVFNIKYTYTRQTQQTYTNKSTGFVLSYCRPRAIPVQLKITNTSIGECGWQPLLKIVYKYRNRVNKNRSERKKKTKNYIL